MPVSIRPSRRFLVQCSVTYNAGTFLKLPLAYCSGFWLLITLLVLSSGPAYGEWVEAGYSKTLGGYTTYLDPDTIRRKGNLVKMWILYDNKTVQTERTYSYLSEKGLEEYDCTEEQSRDIAFYRYSGQMGNGEIMHFSSHPGKWEPVMPNTVGQSAWKVACGKK